MVVMETATDSQVKSRAIDKTTINHNSNNYELIRDRFLVLVGCERLFHVFLLNRLAG